MCVCMITKFNITAQSGHVILVIRKPLIRRDKGDTLSLLVQFLLEPRVPCAPPSALLLSRLSGLAATGPTLISFLQFFLFVVCVYT